MNLPFYYLMNITMLSRLVFVFKDDSLSRRQSTFILILQALALAVFTPGLPLWVLLAFQLAVNTSYVYFERRGKKLEWVRLGVLTIQALVYSVFFSRWIGLEFNPQLAGFFLRLGDVSAILALFDPAGFVRLNILLFGLLLATNEANLLIRVCFQAFGLVASRKEVQKGGGVIIKVVDPREFNAGRIIGILERILMFFFVLRGEVGSIGFILAAKGFARFRELDERSFAEYVLIGTLLSTLAAILVAAGISSLLP